MNKLDKERNWKKFEEEWKRKRELKGERRKRRMKVTSSLRIRSVLKNKNTDRRMFQIGNHIHIKYF